MSFAEWLKRRRKMLGLTQQQLASRINCSVSALRKIEAAERRASVQLVELISEEFNIPKGERKAFLNFARGGWKPDSDRYINEESPWHSTISRRSNLPFPATSLIGREQEIGEIRGYLIRADIRLVTLVGPPGIGKTRLSVEVARNLTSKYSNSVFFLAMSSLDDPSLVIPAIFQMLGYMESKGLPPVRHLAECIGEQHTIFILDNCEHLIEELAPLVSELLSACPNLKILATSRESLRIPGEWQYTVPALAIPDPNSPIDPEHAMRFPALTLFAERARAVRSDFEINSENIQSLSSICMQLDGLPLAIELIAARIRLMSPQALLDRLHDQFVLSANGMRADSVRQRTLENAIGWSYVLLAPEEQKLFAHLSIFLGGFTLEAVESMFPGMFAQKPVRDLVALLLDKSLLQRTTDEQGGIRCDMLLTIRRFALNCLRDMGSETELRNIHLSYFLRLAGMAALEVHGPRQLEWMDRLNNELDNFRTALEWCLSSGQTQACLQLFNALGWTWNVRWSRDEARNWFSRIIEMPDISRFPENHARMLNDAGLREWRMGNYAEARSVLEKGHAIWQNLGVAGEPGLAEVLSRLGMVARWEDENINQAESCFRQSLALYQKHEEEWGVAWNLFGLGGLANDRGQAEKALSLLEQSLGLYNELGDPWGIARASQYLGVLYMKQGDFKKALAFFNRHLANDERLRFMDGVSIALLNLGELFRIQGDFAQAESYYEKSLAICHEYGMMLDVAVNYYNLGLLALQQNNYSKAHHFFTAYFESTREANEKISARDLLIGLAAVAAGTGQPERAAALSGAAQTIFDTSENLFSPFDRAELERHIQMARDELGDKAFEELLARGRKMSIHEAVAYSFTE